jgi:hypothetical protein
MKSLNHKKESFYRECQSSLKSLFPQTIYVFMGLFVMLLITGGNPSGQILTLSFIIGTFFVAWVEQRRISYSKKEKKSESEWLPKKPASSRTTIIQELSYVTAPMHAATHAVREYYIKSIFSHSQDKENRSDISIRMIGGRASGKTTYLASLACYSKLKESNIVQAIIPTNENSLELVSQASHILMKGGQLSPTNFDSRIPNYSLQLIVKQDSKDSPSTNRKGVVNLNIKEYAGEFIEVLSRENSDSLTIKAYNKDISEASGIMLLLDGSDHLIDNGYIDVFLDSIYKDKSARSKHRRIAVAVTKCELASVMMMSKDPRSFVAKNFGHIYETLEYRRKSDSFEVEYFSTSAFGMLDDPLKPNSIELKSHGSGVSAVIKNPAQWKPIGILAPIYWLITGRCIQEV